MKLIPCKHLDHDETKYTQDIQLCRLPPPDEHVLFWRRGKTWTDNGPGNPPNPRDVQFCGAGRGRINSILTCYLGELGCYEPASAPEQELKS